MEPTKEQDCCYISYHDTGYTLAELERIFDKKAYQHITKKKNLHLINIYLLILSALKAFKHTSKNYQESLQEIMYSLETLENSWSWFQSHKQKRFKQLIRYHVLKICDVDL